MIAEMMKLVEDSSPTIGFYARELKRMPLEEMARVLANDPWTSMARCFAAGRKSFSHAELHATTLTEAVDHIIKEHEDATECTIECQSTKLELVENPRVAAWVMKLIKTAVATSDVLVALQAFAYIYRAGLIVGRSRAMRERVFGDGLDEATDGTPE